jgi:orotate phosphoribosyltransferase
MDSRTLLESQIKKGEFVGTSGILLKSYLDCRPLIVDNKTSKIIGYDMIMLIGRVIGTPLYLSVGTIGGATFAGSHLAQAISYHNVVPGIQWFAFHSKKNTLILPFEKPKKCVLVDDVLTTGSTFKRMIPTVVDAGIKIQAVFVIVDRREDPTKMVSGYGIHSLFKMTPEGELYE